MNTLLHRRQQLRPHPEQLEVIGSNHAQVHIASIRRDARDLVGSLQGRLHASVADAPLLCGNLLGRFLHVGMVRLGRVG